MDITVKYMPTEEDPCGRVERLTTPLESGWDRWRAGFLCIGGTWCLAAEKWDKDDKKGSEWGWFHWKNYLMLKHDGGSVADYEDWLEQTVAYIAIDGQTYWANSQLQEG